MKKFEEKTVSSETLFKGRVISLQVDEVELPNGKTGKREIIKHPGAVAVIAITDEGKMIMVEQYRKAMERSLVEIPAGKLELGEEPLRSAERELEEETGYGSAEMKHLISFYTSPGFADELVHVFVATGLTKKETRQTVMRMNLLKSLSLRWKKLSGLLRKGKLQMRKPRMLYSIYS